MSEAIIVLFILALWHFLYQGVIAPCARLGFRNELFELRDELRQMMIEGVDEEDLPFVEYLHNGITFFLQKMPFLSISKMSEMRREYESSSSIRAKVQNRRKILDESDNQRLHEIFDRTSEILAKSYFFNGGGWIVYLVPVVLGNGVWKSIVKAVQAIVITRPPSDGGSTGGATPVSAHS